MNHLFRTSAYALLLFGAFLFGRSHSPLVAQNTAVSQAQETVFQAYLSGNSAMWSQTVDDTYASWKRAGSKTDAQLFELCVLEYGYLGLCQQEEVAVELEVRLDRLTDWLEALKRQGIRPAAATAMLGGATAMRIEVDSWHTISLGLKSRNLIEAAVEMDASDPIVWVELGNLRYHAPRLFGGGQEEAVTAFGRALQLWEAQPQARSWMWLHASVWLAQSYAATDQYTQAASLYRDLLTRYPNFVWVKEELFPPLSQKMR